MPAWTLGPRRLPRAGAHPRTAEVRGERARRPASPCSWAWSREWPTRWRTSGGFARPWMRRNAAPGNPPHQDRTCVRFLLAV